MTVVESSFCRSKSFAAMLISADDTGERMRPTARIGISAMITLRKMMPRSTRIRTTVASPTIASALLPDSAWS